jgi:hypothetical protein
MPPPKKELPAPTEKKTHATIKSVELRLVLIDQADAAYGDKEYELKLISQKFTGKTNAQGLITQVMPSVGGDGELLLKLPAPEKKKEPKPAPATTPAKAKSPPPYPLLIDAAAFKDTPAPPDPYQGPRLIRWKLKVVPLKQFDKDPTAGAQERLHNLGFYIDGERGAPGPKTEAAVTAYQKKYKLTETGKLTDVQGNLTQRHDTI